jgi:hypothetical protein
MDGAIKKANEKMTFISSDKEALRLYHLREMALSDWTSGINYAKKEEKIETAKKAIEENLSFELISKLTGLDKNTIKNLNNN